jgi:uncharacterized protein
MKPTEAMQMSPYDRGTSAEAAVTLIQLGYRSGDRWVPSRFNARTLVEDGRLILWNTFSGAISVFGAKDSERVLGWLDSGGARGKLDKTGEYLHRRGYLVNATMNEMERFRYRFAQDQWRTDKLELILLASEDCNFRCVYCYEKFARGTMAPEVRQGLSSLVLKRASTLRELQVSWFGGEPLYGWEAIEEMAPVFWNVSQQHGIQYNQHMTTNGYLLTEERATKLLGWGLRDWQITLDGSAADHDCKRVGRDGSGTYSTILDNLRSLRDRRDEQFKVKIRVNFDNRNFPRLGPFLEALSEDFAGDSRFVMRFRPVGKWGGDNDDNLDTCGLGQDRAAGQALQRKAEEVGLTQEGGIAHMATPGSGVCYAARPYSFIVGAHGHLMKCTVALYEEESNVVGKVLADGTLELNDDHMLRWVNPAFESDELCQHCHVLPVCQGAHCPLTRITEQRRTCAGVKSTLKHDMRFTLHEHDKARAAAESALVPAMA